MRYGSSQVIRPSIRPGIPNVPRSLLSTRPRSSSWRQINPRISTIPETFWIEDLRTCRLWEVQWAVWHNGRDSRPRPLWMFWEARVRLNFVLIQSAFFVSELAASGASGDTSMASCSMNPAVLEPFLETRNITYSSLAGIKIWAQNFEASVLSHISLLWN